MIKYIFILFILFPIVSNADIVVKQNDMDLSGALEATAKDLKVRLINNISVNKQKQKVNQYLSGDGMKLLKTLSQIYNFDWFIYGSTLTVESDVRYSNVPYKPKNISSQSLLKKINQYFKTSSTAKMLSDKKGGYIIFSGTPNLLNSILDFSEMIDKNDFLENKNNLEVAKLNFNYISVNDRSITSYGADVSFPGAASLISNAMDNIGQFSNLSDQKIIEKTYKIKLKESDKPELQLQEQTKKVQAIPNTNSLLIRGTSEEINLAKRIAKLIDIKRKQIMFSVRVYDINLKSSNSYNLPSSLANNPINSSIISSFISTVSFINNFKALQSKGIINSVYSTNLVVLENQEGSFGKSDSIAIKLVSKNEAKLQTITADNSVYVTGRYLPSGAVKAAIRYTDSNFGSFSEDSAPQQSSQNLTSEIYIKPKQTVILGGFEKTITESSVSGIPVLSSIPVLGYLFKTTSKAKNKAKRFISISFRVMG